MTIYKSDKLLSALEKEIDNKLNAKQRSAMQKIIRSYFISVHKEAVEKTIIAKNRINRTFEYPNFED